MNQATNKTAIDALTDEQIDNIARGYFSDDHGQTKAKGAIHDALKLAALAPTVSIASNTVQEAAQGMPPTWQERAKAADDFPCFSGDTAAPYIAAENADLRAALAQRAAVAEVADELGDLPSDDYHMPFMCLIEKYMSACDYHGSQTGERCTVAEEAIRAALTNLRGSSSTPPAPSGASVDSPELIALLDAYCQDGTKGYEHHYRRIVAHIDAWHSSRASVDSVARLLKAATVYATGYCQDEAEAEDDPDYLVCGLEQHLAAVELFAAIAAMSPTKAGEGK